jgi:hypothetical protein
MKLSDREKRILSVIIASWGIFFVGSGLVMQITEKTTINTKYNLSIEKHKIAETQAKTNEIKLKEITIEVNNPISADIKDYLEDVNTISSETIKSLKLDTSLVNINQTGTYQYTITYGKKKYINNIIIKEKELPTVEFTLKNITLTIGDAISTNPRTYINEEITEDVYNNLTLDLSEINSAQANTYSYYIIYKNTKYEGKIIIQEKGPTIITPNNKDDKTNTDKTTDDTTTDK